MNSASRMVGALRVSVWFQMPTEKALASAKADAGSWRVA